MITKKEESLIEKMIEFTNKGIELEEKIIIAKEQIRKKSKENYETKLIESRLFLLSISYDLMLIREGEPCKTSKSISNRINLIATYIQGVDIVENSIMEGQYTKASAIIKQDYEILTRIIEVKSNKEKEGKTPNVQHLPEEFRKFYGYLNKISHPSNSSIIENFITKLNKENYIGITYIPAYNKKLVKAFYDLHLLIMYNIVFEKITLLIEMYGKEIIPEMEERQIIHFLQYVKNNLISCGIISELNEK